MVIRFVDVWIKLRSTIMLRLLLMMEPVNIILDIWMWFGLKILK